MCGLLRFHKGEVLLLQASPESQSPWRGSWTILDAFRVQSLQVNARVSLNSGSQGITRPHSAQTPPPRPDTRDSGPQCEESHVALLDRAVKHPTCGWEQEGTRGDSAQCSLSRWKTSNHTLLHTAGTCHFQEDRRPPGEMQNLET